MEKLETLPSKQNQVKDFKFQDKLGDQNFHEDMKIVFETVTDTIKNMSEEFKKVHDINF